MTTTSRRTHKCVDCGKRIGWDYLNDVGIGIPMVVGEKITDKEAKQVTREVARNIKRPCWICADVQADVLDRRENKTHVYGQIRR